MATTGFWPVRGNLKKVLDYADNPDKTTDRKYVDNDLYDTLRYTENDDKTDERKYVSGVNCTAANAYSEMLRARSENVLDDTYRGSGNSPFRREELLRLYDEGQTSASEVLLVRRKDGEPGYVRFEATLSKMPVTGDVVAFIAERPCNEERNN